MSNGRQMSEMRTEVGRPDRPAVSSSRSRVSKATGNLGLFGATGGSNNGRGNPPVQPEVSDFDGSIRNELLRLLMVPLSDLKDMDLDGATVGQVLARVLMLKAVADQNMTAITEVLDRLEGKASKSAQNKPTNQHIGDQLDANLSDLDSLLEKS